MVDLKTGIIEGTEKYTLELWNEGKQSWEIFAESLNEEAIEDLFDNIKTFRRNLRIVSHSQYVIRTHN